MNLRESGCENVNWTELFQDSVQMADFYHCSDGPLGQSPSLTCACAHTCTHKHTKDHAQKL